MSAGLSCSQFARVLDTQVGTVCRWEAGRSVPNPENLAAIATALGIEIADLFDGPPRPTVKPNAAQLIRQERARRGVLQSELASRLGVRRQRMHQIERGVPYGPSVQMCCRVAAALGCDSRVFVNLDGDA